MLTKKEMKQKYKEMKTPMGVVMIRNHKNGKALMVASKDTNNIINRMRFELKLGSHKVREMQEDWKKYGEAAFAFEILEHLPYDDQEEKADYSDELEILKMICIDRLRQNGELQLYNK